MDTVPTILKTAGPDHLNHVCFGRCGSCAYRVSAAGGAQDNLAMTGFDFTNDLAEPAVFKIVGTVSITRPSPSLAWAL